MPSKTKKQAKFMAAVANSPDFAKKVGVPQSVGKEFAAADKAKEDAEELPAGHYDTHVRLQRGGRWNAHTVNVRKTDKELIKKFLDQGFRVVKPFEDNERYDDRDPVDDDALERARKEEKDLESIEVDSGSVPTMTNVRKRVKDLDDKIKRAQLEVADKMQFKNFYKKRNG